MSNNGPKRNIFTKRNILKKYPFLSLVTLPLSAHQIECSSIPIESYLNTILNKTEPHRYKYESQADYSDYDIYLIPKDWEKFGIHKLKKTTSYFLHHEPKDPSNVVKKQMDLIGHNESGLIAIVCADCDVHLNRYAVTVFYF